MLAVNILISVFGVASAFSPNYYVLLLLRGIVGFGIGGGILGYVIFWYEKCGMKLFTTQYYILYRIYSNKMESCCLVYT